MDLDVIVIGAGAAGTMCAIEAARRGRRVLLVDHWKRVGERIRISGGGRCNFTNRVAGAEHYLSQNPDFCRSALARYAPRDFVALVGRHGIPYEEREHGQLFCRRSAMDIVGMLRAEADAAGVRWATPCRVAAITLLAAPAAHRGRFRVTTDHGTWDSHAVVVATGGLAAPKLGATGFAFDMARQFGLRVVEPRPALVPLTLDDSDFAPVRGLAGVAFDSRAACHARRDLPAFRERTLITHLGLSGPAILQVSSYWQQAARASGVGAVTIDLVPGCDAEAWIASARQGRRSLVTVLSERIPRRLAQGLADHHAWPGLPAELSNQAVTRIARRLQSWVFTPSGTLGFAKAEVCLGGVDTRDLSSKTMEAARVAGLYFVGEAVDVTGWLGGYNFQWAWSSGWVAGQYC